MVRKRCVNPFVHRLTIKPFDYIWITFGLIFLVPIRIILSVILFLIASGMAKVGILVMSSINKQKDPDNWQKWRLRFKRITIHVFRAVFTVCGYCNPKVIHKGDPNKEENARIYVFAPHTSLFDIFAGVVLGAPSAVAKADIVDIPFFGNIFRLCDPVLVERDNKNSRQDVFTKVDEVIKYSRIVFFPEGTCSNRQALLQFKAGAFKFGYPVIPAALRYDQGGVDTLIWTWDGPSTLWMILLSLARWHTNFELTILDVYNPSEQEKNEPQLYADNVAKVLAQELQVPQLYYSFDDVRYIKYKTFRSSTCFKLMKLIDKIGRLHIETKNGSQSNGTPASKDNENLNESPKKKYKFENFLCDTIDEINLRLSKEDLNKLLDKQKLIELLNIQSKPAIATSFTLKELFYCFEKSPTPFKVLHFKSLITLIDLRNNNLWERLKETFDKFRENDDRSSVLSYEDLKVILWLALNLENVDEDKEIRDIRIMSFDDLRNMLLNHYGFALSQNAPSIYQE